MAELDAGERGFVAGYEAAISAVAAMAKHVPLAASIVAALKLARPYRGKG